MKKQILLLLIFALSFNCYSQVGFEKGYYIDNAEKRNDVLIKNVGWKNNPESFEYKTSEDAEVQTATMNSVKEFAVNNTTKYRRARVKIDRSGEDLANISVGKELDFNKEDLFLKVIIEGNATLYQYKDDNLTRYFFSTEDLEIEQLVYKTYSLSSTRISKNNSFRQQLWSSLQCPTFKMSRFERLDYTRKDLVRLFREYNKCQNSEITFEPKVTKAQLQVSLRPRVNSTSLIIQNPGIPPVQADFGNQKGFGFGVEAELILPFNRNKWSVFIEPTFQYYEQEAVHDRSDVFGRNLMFKTDYKSIEVPVGLRHYIFLNKKSKIFVNASLVVDLVIDSSIIYSHQDNSNYTKLDIQSLENYAVGLGYKYNNKYSLEFRYFTNRDVLGEYIAWKSSYKSASIILGYTIF